LDRVIRARKIHHSHFFAQEMDYGHEKFLNSLITQKLTTQRALERATQRMAEVLYQERKWFKWARECQDQEDKQRESEQKKIKLEAALFRRQAKELESRMHELRAKEDARKQEEYLENAYQESVANRTDESESEDFDPIDDLIENERGSYLQLIKHFLWLEVSRFETADQPGQEQSGTTETKREPLAELPNNLVNDDTQPQSVPTGKKKKKIKKGKARADSPMKADSQQASSSALQPHRSTSRSGNDAKQPSARGELLNEPDVTKIEGREDLHSRLLEGTKPVSSDLMYMDSDGTAIEFKAMPPMEAEEAARLVDEVGEIKKYLFCRLLINNAVLLPSAVKANSLDEFLNDKEVKAQDLRDLCLKLEQPELQVVRDACADFFRKDNEPEFDDDSEVDTDDSESEASDGGLPFWEKRHRHHVPRTWRSNREKARKQSPMPLPPFNDDDEEGVPLGTTIDFGRLDREGNFRRANVRIKICGRHVYNYPSQFSMKRRGWRHFATIARGCRVEQAAELCKSWEEFFELSTLATYRYFPSPEWLLWAGDRERLALLRLNFVVNYSGNNASEKTYHRTGRGLGGRKMHASREVRAFVCAHMKRNDPISRRFISYVSMQSSRLLILVRDPKSGRIITKPPDDDLWLVRLRAGYGRANRTEWETQSYVGPEFFKEAGAFRKFHLGFDDYYDVYIWAASPGVLSDQFYQYIAEVRLI
jgi:hypothetical protein